MIKKRSSGLLALMALQASLAQGLGLGDITLHSALDQPLVADIRLRGVGDLGPGQILVNLASGEDFERAGVERTFFLTDMDFAIELRGDGSGTIRVTTERPVKEPYLDFVLELRWPNGRVLREYTVLLDLPTYVAVDQGGGRAAVAGVPSGRDVAAGSAAGGWSGDTYGPVASQETLWSIASRVRPAGVSVQRMMVAIQRANPDAFIRDNINLLKAGAVLRIPALDALQGLSDTEARAEVSSQNAAWQSVTPTAAPEAAQAAPGGEAAPAESGAYLRLAGDDASAAVAESAAGGEAPAEVEGLRNDLAATQDSLSAAELENAELRSRVSSLEEQVRNYERLVELKSDEIAAVQETAAEAVEPAPAEPEIAAPIEAAQAPEAVTPAPQPSWLDRLMQNTTAMVAALLALLIAMLAFLFKRRQLAESYAPLPEATHAVARRQAAAAAAAPAPAPAAPAPEPARAARPEPPPAEGPAEPVTGDPISEADIYVAYGRHERAVELLRSAMASEPERSELRLKLMEIYADQGQREAFLREYEALSAAGDGEALSAARGLLEGPAASWLGETAEEEVGELVKADVEDVGAFEEELELDLQEEAQEALGELELGAPDAEAVMPEEAPTEAVAEPVFDEENEFDILAGTDEVETKLELARAYVDMGDVEGARDILDEVIKEGQPHQREQANELLARLDND